MRESDFCFGDYGLWETAELCWSADAYRIIEDHECDWTQDALYMVEVENNFGMYTVNDESIPATEYDTFLFMHYKERFKYNAATA